MSSNRYDGVDSYAVFFVRYQTKHLITTHPRFTDADYEDIEQELMFHLLLKLPLYNPSQGAKSTFIARVVRRKAIDLIRLAEADIRGGRSAPISLHQTLGEVDDAEAFELIETISSEAGLWGDAYLGWRHLDAELRNDLEKALAELPPKLAHICEQLKEKTVSEISRDMGIPRSTIDDAVKKLRKILGAKGLKIYLS